LFETDTIRHRNKYITWTEKENINETIAKINQQKKEGPRVLREKKTKNSFEIESVTDKMHYYNKFIQGEGKLFMINTSVL